MTGFFSLRVLLRVALGATAAAGVRVTAQVPEPATSFAASAFFTTSDSVRLHFLESGRGHPIVFVPGWTMPAWIWEPQIRALSSRYRVIALDPRSQGRSETATEGHFHERRARDIRELIQHLDLQDVALVGWSLGVPEVLTYMELFRTDRLTAVVLVDGFLWMPSGPGVEDAKWFLTMQDNRHAFADRFVRGMYTQPQSEEYLNRVIQAHLRTPTSIALTLGVNAAMGARSDWRATIARVDRPLLFVTTRPGRWRTHGDTLKRLLPAARVEVFEGAGHALFVDFPERFNTLLDEFLRLRY